MKSSQNISSLIWMLMYLSQMTEYAISVGLWVQSPHLYLCAYVTNWGWNNPFDTSCLTLYLFGTILLTSTCRDPPAGGASTWSSQHVWTSFSSHSSTQDWRCVIWPFERWKYNLYLVLQSSSSGLQLEIKLEKSEHFCWRLARYMYVQSTQKSVCSCVFHLYSGIIRCCAPVTLAFVLPGEWKQLKPETKHTYLEWSLSLNSCTIKDTFLFYSRFQEDNVFLMLWTHWRKCAIY